MGASNSPPKGIVQSVTAVGLSVLRSVNLLGAEKPAGVRWKSKASSFYMRGSETSCTVTLGMHSIRFIVELNYTQASRERRKRGGAHHKLARQHLISELGNRIENAF